MEATFERRGPRGIPPVAASVSASTRGVRRRPRTATFRPVAVKRTRATTDT